MRGSVVLVCELFLFAGAGQIPAQNVDYVSSTLWGYDRSVQVVGDYAYCAFARGLVVLDVSDPASPILAGQKPLPGYGYEICVAGNYAYLADGNAGLQIVDISDPSNPDFVGGCDSLGQAKDVFVAGDYAYLACGLSGVQIVNIVDPANPTHVAGYGIPDYSYRGIFVSGDFAYVADGSLKILDVSDPANPFLAGSHSTHYSSQRICVSGNYAYVAEIENDGWYLWGRLEIFDVSDPHNPSPVASIGTDAYTNVYVDGNYALATGYTFYYGFAQVIDVSDPNNPLGMGLYQHRARAYDITVAGNQAYVVGNGFDVIDFSDLWYPVRVGRYPGSDTRNVFVSGDYAYATDEFYGLEIVDVSDPANPVFTGGCETSGTPTGIYAAGDYAYVVDWLSGLQIVDISDAYDPIVAGTYNMDNLLDVFVSGDYAFVISQFTLQILNISDPYGPVPAGSYNSLVEAYSVFVSGDYAYAACGRYGLRIVNVSNPYNPFLVGICDTPGIASGVFVSGDYAYVADYWSGLQIINVSDPANPVLAGNYATPERAEDVFVSGDYAYVAVWYSGLKIVDISDPYDPMLAGSYDARDAQGVFVSEDYTYLADVTSLMILQFNPQTGIEDVGGLPRKFSLDQNYPNPFNASTRISYSLPEAGDVTIDIYDLLGRRVHEVFKAKQAAGEHQVLWDAGDIPSGIYFARLRAGSHRDVIRMTLLK